MNVVDEARALLRDIADGKPIEVARVHALADAVLQSEIVKLALSIKQAESKFILRRAIELAGLLVATGSEVDGQAQPSQPTGKGEWK